MPKKRSRAQDEPEESDGGGKKLPVVSFRFPGSPGSIVELAVWENSIDLADGGSTTGYAASFNRSFKARGKWQKTRSFRLQDLWALQYGIAKVIDWLMENKKPTDAE